MSTPTPWRRRLGRVASGMRDGRLEGWRRTAVPASLMLSYLLNDGEEVLTMAATFPRTLARAPRWVPDRLRKRSVTQGHVNAAVALMGVLVVAAAVDGFRTRGRGWLYQDVQLAFGLHGFFHIASSIATRGYTSGVLTSPTVVIPQGWLAGRALRRAGVPNVSHLRRAVPLTLGWLAASHVAASRITRDRS